MKSIISILLLSPLLAGAQPRLGLYTGMSFPASTIPFGARMVLEEPVASRWHEPGLSLGASCEFPVLTWLSVGPVFEYNRYFFRKPEMYWAGYPFYIDASGTSSHIYRILLEARIFHEAASHNRICLSTGLGYSIENLGVVTFTYYDHAAVDWRPQGKNYLAHSLGFGYKFALSQKLALDLCAKYYSNYTDRCDVSTNIGVVYIFEQ